MSGEFFPHGIEDFCTWGDNFVAQVTAHATAWGIPADEEQRLFAAWNKYIDAQYDADQPVTRTRLAVAEATRLRKLAIAEFRRIKVGYIDSGLRLGKINETEYKGLGLKPPDYTHTPKADPIDYVDFNISASPGSHRIAIGFRIRGSRNFGKGHYHAAEIRYWLRDPIDPAPADANETGWSSEVATASPWQKDFEGADLNKRFWASLRWENRSVGRKGTSGKGPWAIIMGTNIP
jgi:hypothetical protein